MLMTHVWGLYAHTKQEWHDIDRNHAGISSSISHILLIALIPAICAYVSTVYLGWKVGNNSFYLTPDSALFMSIAMYCALVIGVVGLAFAAQWMAKTFNANTTYQQTLELSAYIATPIFMVGFSALYPHPWFIMIAGFIGVAYAVYLLYTGVPIIMHIPEERGFIYASSLVTVGLVMLVSIMIATVILWSSGVGPVFSN
ncbi:YIP1 family protein [Alginatibacterium sediminis]|uniref:YIP1 family protein n=1 Tax=Alginatibacterium sediminis TaxID=2164068 RepID=A0A420EAY6_9ALTE|nr:Yip1 family protein [Alginatibacterium sediminis]RKF17857.1 YIP1 family protein [Alginatibacterium sediminis]